MNLTKKEIEFIYEFFGRIDGHLFFHIFRDLPEEQTQEHYNTFLKIYGKAFDAIPKDDVVPDEEKSIEELHDKLDFYKKRIAEATSDESRYYWDLCIKNTVDLIKAKSERIIDYGNIKNK